MDMCSVLYVLYVLQTLTVNVLKSYCTEPGSWRAGMGARRSRGATTRSS